LTSRLLKRVLTLATSDRLVDVPRLKKAVESIYLSVLPKGTLPWLYIRYMAVLGSGKSSRCCC
jgi:hypothetical protein